MSQKRILFSKTLRALPVFCGRSNVIKVVSVLGLARPYGASAPISVSPSMSEAKNLLFSFAGTPALKLNRAKP